MRLWNAVLPNIPTIEATYKIAEMIMKVKEAIEAEYSLTKKANYFLPISILLPMALTIAMVKTNQYAGIRKTLEESRTEVFHYLSQCRK